MQRAVAGFGGIFEAHVFGVVEVGGEELGGGEEFVFDHNIDIIVGEALVHVPFRRRVRSLSGWDGGASGVMLDILY